MIPIIAAFNSTELLDSPITYLLTVFTDLLGDGFMLIPVSVIAGALFIQKNYDPVPMSLFMLTSGALLGGGSLFAGWGEMSILYIIFSGVGLATLFLSIFFGGK